MTIAHAPRTKGFVSTVNLEEEVYVALQRVAEHLTAEAVDVLRPADLTGPAYNVLRILRGAGDAGASCNEIGDRMLKRDSDITRLLDRLEKRGLIERRRAEDDRRVVRTRITPSGLALLAELDAPVAQRHRDLLAHVDAARLEQLLELLGAIMNK
jgi:DNA-binding MarR family transcriptional regulator